MKVLYRADGGHPIGTGHIFRAVRILRAITERVKLEAVLMVADDHFAVNVARTAPALVNVLPRRSDLHAVKPLLDAAPVLDALSAERFDLVVVDMLDTPEKDMAALAATGVPVATFDDRGPGRIYADAVINILVEEPEPECLKPHARLLQGGSYAVLDPVFAESGKVPIPRDFSQRCRVFVGMGGADAAGLTVKVARALRLVPELTDVALVNGPACPHRARLDAVLENAPWPHTVYTALPNLLDLYRWCDLAIVAGGLTMYEVCCTGTPAIAVPQPIDHQFELAEILTKAGAMTTVGYGLDASIERIAVEVARLAQDMGTRRKMSERGPALVDGCGTERVANALIDLAIRR